MSKNYYPEMLDGVLKTNGTVTYEHLFHWFAKHRPHSVIQAIKAINQTLSPKFTEPAYIEDCRQLINSNRSIIPAIKHWREKTGHGLKEAKEAIEKLRGTMQK